MSEIVPKVYEVEGLYSLSEVQCNVVANSLVIVYIYIVTVEVTVDVQLHININNYSKLDFIFLSIIIN